MAIVRLGKVQMRIMRELWRRDNATARELTAALAAGSPIAHSTVQTLLRKLEAKGAVAHRVSERTFIFQPLISEASVRRSATREFLNRLFGGSPSGLVAYLVNEEHLSKRELRRIRDLIKQEGKK
jgi:BlaI family penicillinase repressor